MQPPKKIYITTATAATLNANDGAGTMRVKTRPGKQNTEYTDLRQVWHTADEMPSHPYTPLVIAYRADGNYFPRFIADGICSVWKDISLGRAWRELLDEHGDDFIWAYWREILPTPTKEEILKFAKQ